MKRLPSRLVAGGLVFFLSSCASRPHGSLAPQEGDENVYFRWFEAQNRAFQESSLSALRLFESATSVFEKSVQERVAHDGTLAQMPTVLAHGNFHPRQMAYFDGEPQLKSLDESARLPLWHDLLRMESAGVVLATEQSLTTYHPGACLAAYGERLKQLAQHESPSSSGAPLPLRPQAELASGKASQLPAWTESEREVDPSILQSIEKSWPDADNKFRELRRLPTDPASERLRYLALTENGTILEFRQEFAVEPWKTGCERYLAAARTYFPKTRGRCFAPGGQDFAILPWPHRYWQPAASDFTSAELLGAHVRWMCGELAEAHARELGPNRVQEVAIILERHPNLNARLRAFAEAEAKLALAGYRTILKQGLD